MMWIGPFDENFQPGDRAFLVRKEHNTKGWTQHELRDVPPQTNQSFAYRLHGWCGTYNDLATYGEGAIEVVKLAANGRLQVKPLVGAELQTFLDDSGFPELAPTEESKGGTTGG